jgi:hypothetical protein
MTDRKTGQLRHPEAAPSPGRPAWSDFRRERASAPTQVPGQALMEAGTYTDFAMRRVPPPEGPPQNASPRNLPPVRSDGSLPQRADAAFDGQPTTFVTPGPASPPQPKLERPVSPSSTTEAVDPKRPAAGARSLMCSFVNNRRITVIQSDQTPQIPDPTASRGPKLNEARALVQARLDQRAKRRASRSRPRQDAATGGGYVTKASTQAELIARGKGLFARYRRECGLQIREEDVDPRDFVIWLMSLKPSLALSSWRTYRAAASAWIQTVPHDGLAEALAALDADIGVGADAGRARPSGGRGRTDVAKRFPRADFDKVVRKGGKFSRSKARPWLIDWMLASIHTGLWPWEWAATDLEVISDFSRPQGRLVLLHVLNTNSNAARAKPVQRTLDISNFSEDAYETVRRHAERAAAWSKSQQFDMRHSQCAQLLYTICKMLFPLRRQRYTLDSLRHQFVANMKTIYNPPQVAALVGHISSEDTVVEHYGKRRAAWLDDEICEIPVPMKEQVKLMERQWKQYEEWREAKKLRKEWKDRRREAAMARKKAKRPMLNK